MRPFRRVRMLHADDYRVLKRAVTSRKTAAGKARRARIVLLSNQGHTAREIAAELDCNERTALKRIGRTTPPAASMSTTPGLDEASGTASSNICDS